MVEPSPSSPFIMAQSKFLLQVLVIALDPPAQLGQIDQAAERDIVGQGPQPVFGRLLFVLRPFNEQPFFGTRLGEAFITMGGAHPQPGEARAQPIGRPLAPGNRLPSRSQQAEGERFGLNRLVLAIPPGPRGPPTAAGPGVWRQRSPARRPNRRVRPDTRDTAAA